MIVTFYSYKGGTGRTMALANIAVLLAKAGRRVLVVDFDLEAPGVWRFYNEFQDGLDNQPGLLDMLFAHVSGLDPSTVDWHDYTTIVRFGTDAITLMTSGKLDVEYPARVLGFDWAGFFRDYGGGQFLENLRDAWNREYDFVLIDSRTGITDIGGICTIALPDMIVPVFVANNQNIDGVVDVLRRAQRGRQKLAYDRPPALVLPVLSRFDSRTEFEFVNEWLSLASSRLGEFYSDWLPRTVDPRVVLERTKLPYIAYFGFGEKIAVLLQGVTDPDSLGYALNSVAKLIESHLADLSPVSPDITGVSVDRVPVTRLEPPSDSWIAAIHNDQTLIGSAFAIDDGRLITAAHVVSPILAQDDGMARLSISFPKSDDDSLHRVASITISNEPERYDVAIIHLMQPVPQSIDAAKLRFASASELTGREWWSFGFPDGNRLGNSASGTVGAALAFGSIRLDTKSRYSLNAGFSGAAVWSPEFAAVVGLIAHRNPQGDGIAVTLDWVEQAVPDERLRLLSDWSTEHGPDAGQREIFIGALADVFYSESTVTSLLLEIGFPRERIPRWAAFASSRLYWERILTELENGIIKSGPEALAAAAAANYPGNPVFRETTTLRPYSAIADARPEHRNVLWGREIPFRNPHFAGRARELSELRRQLVEASTTLVAQPGIPLYGLGGVGKTEIAAEYAHRFRNEYSLCWWVRCEREELIISSLLNLGRMMRLPDLRVDERDYSAQLVIEALNTGDPYSSWLLIFDNAIDAKVVARYIPRGPGQVIVTTRDARMPVLLRSDGIEVGEFQPTETVEFLRKRVHALTVLAAEPHADKATRESVEAENARRENDAAELAAELANLPLAAEHAAAYLAETGVSVPEYLQLYRDNAYRLLAADVDISYPHAAATAWSVSRQTISPTAAALFELLAFFAPESIHEKLLLQPGRVPDLPSELAPVLSEVGEFRRAIRELGRFSLVRIDGARNNIRMHRVVRAVTQSRFLREDPAKAAEYRWVVHALLAASDPDAPERDDSQGAYELSRRHLIPSGALASANPLVRRLVINQVQHLCNRGALIESLNLGSPALVEWREGFGAEDRQTLALAAQVGIALRDIGRWEEAQTLNAHTLERVWNQFGEEDQAYLTCARSRGVDLRFLGRYDEALDNDLRLLPLHELVLHSPHVEMLHLFNDIAISLCCLGRFEEALEYDRQTLAERARLLGATDTGTLTSRLAIARDLRQVGRFEEALDEIRAVNEILEDKSEPWNKLRLLSAADLGIALRRGGFYDEAAVLGGEILQRLRDALGDKHRETLRIATNVINDRRLIGDVRGSQDLGKWTLAGWEQTVGADHPNTVATRANLALALRAQGNPVAARELNERALEDFVRIFGAEHPSPITVMANLASDLAMLGEVQRARQFGERALELSRQIRGVTHPCTLATAANLSLDRRADGDAAGSQQLHEETIAYYPNVLGSEHPESRLAAQRGRIALEIEPMSA